MKIYFAGSIRGGRDDENIYARFVEELKTHGEVLTEHVGSPNVLANEVELDDKQIHDRDVAWLEESDVLIAEVTQVSLGVGYEIGRAKTMDLPIICLFRSGGTTKRLSAMISGAQGPKFKVHTYQQVNEAIEFIRTEIKTLKEAAAKNGVAVNEQETGDNPDSTE